MSNKLSIDNKRLLPARHEHEKKDSLCWGQGCVAKSPTTRRTSKCWRIQRKRPKRYLSCPTLDEARLDSWWPIL